MKRYLWIKPMIILSIAALLGGCAIGRTTNYHTGTVDYNTGFTKDVYFAVAFQDVRPYVLSGNKKNTFVGLMRSVTGIPYPINTESGKPLADDFGSIVTNSLRSKGLNAEYLKFQFRKDADDFVKENSKEGMKILVFSLHEWKTDLHFTGSIHYDVSLAVYDSIGNQIASTRQEGHDPMGPNERVGRRNLGEANVDIIGGLLKAPKIQAAILSDETVLSAEKKVESKPQLNEKCSVKQVLKMKDAGLSDNQIEAACE